MGRVVSLPRELMEMAETPLWLLEEPEEDGAWDEPGAQGGAASVERWAGACALTAAEACGAGSTGEVYALYRAWAECNGEGRTASKTAFSRALRRMLGVETFTARSGGALVRRYRRAEA